MEKTEFVLHTDKLDKVLRGSRCFANLGNGKIGTTDRAHFSRAHEFIQGTKRFHDRCLRIRLMQLIQINPIGSQPSQTRFDRFPDIFRRCAPPAWLCFHAELRRQNDLVAPLAEGAPQKVFALPFAVAIGGIKKGNAGFNCRIDDLRARFGIDPPPEIITAKPDDGDFE